MLHYECACGRSHAFEDERAEIRCPCGAMYIATVTEIRAAEEAAL